MKRCFLLFVLTIIFNLSLTAQDIYYQTLGNKQGLSQSSAVSFWQDNIGRIWIGNDALNCFDGENVEVFRVSEYLSGIEDSNIHAFCGNDSILFFLAENTLIFFNLHEEVFFNTEIFTYSICYANNRLYYLSRDGIFFAYDWKTKISTPIISIEEKINGSDFIIEKEEGEFWIASPAGVYIINENKKEITQILLQDKHVVSLYKDSYDYIWIVTQDHNIFLYTPEDEIILLSINEKEMIFPNSIFCIQEDAKGSIWIGTLTGIYQLTREGNMTFKLRDHILNESTIYALFSDRQGTIWVGSYYGDVRYYNPAVDNYTYYATDETNPARLHGAVIGQITKDKHGNMYFATEGSGINILRPGRNSFEHITTKEGLPQNKIRALWYDEEYDRLFISSYMEGICYLDIKTQTIRYLNHGALRTIHQRIVENMFFYKGDLILHTQNGIFKLDRSTLDIDWFFPEGAVREKCSGIIRTVFIDDKDIMWISSFRSGLFTIDLKTGKELNSYGDGITENSKIPSAIIKIHGDNRRGLFFVSLRSGVLRYNAAADSFFVFNKNTSPLISDICYNIAYTQSGKLIVTSNKGISLLDIPSDSTISSVYTIRINPTSPLTAFIGDCGIFTLPENDGDIYVGGVYGLFRFSEKDIPTKQNDYSLFFSSIHINNETVLPNSPLLGKSFYLADKIVLPHNKNTIAIKFASSNYLSSRTSQYEYILKGQDEFWTETNYKTITYSALRPGSYRLIVREVANKEKSAELEIIIRRPIWTTAAAIFIYILTVLFITGWIIRFYRSKTILRASLEMERREIARIEETNQHKMDFFVNIANEFRTPITLILSLIERLPQDLPTGGKSKIEKIKRQATNLQELITEILDFRKMEQNKLSLKINTIDLTAFIQKIYTSFSDYASEKQIVFRFNHNNELIPLWFDQRQIQKVFYNLLSFVFRLSAPKDSITISIHRGSGFMKAQITCKGNGITEYNWDNFLDIFRKASSLSDISSLPDGTIGIAYCKGIIELHKGNISVNNENDKLVIVISLPMGTSHFNLADIQQDTEKTLPPEPLTIDEIIEDEPFWQEKVSDSDQQKKSFRMLLIEEDYEMRHLLKETFSILYEVIEFDDAQEAYHYAVRELPDIIISEINLPGISGIEMCAMLKSNINTDHLPVILLSSQPSVQQNMESIRSGAEYYFGKPFNIRILFLRCNYLMKNRQTTAQHDTNDSSGILEMATNEKEQEFLSAANTIVEENIFDPSFDTTVWHKQLSMGRTRFFYQIKDITGMTPHEYLIYLKMNKARKLLEENNQLTIAEIAYKLGFGTPPYFSKCFKKQFGVTPQEYKRKN